MKVVEQRRTELKTVAGRLLATGPLVNYYGKVGPSERACRRVQAIKVPSIAS